MYIVAAWFAFRCFPISKCQTDKETCCLKKRKENEKKKHKTTYTLHVEKYRVKFAQIKPYICGVMTFALIPLTRSLAYRWLFIHRISHHHFCYRCYHFKNEGESLFRRINIEGVNKWANACGVYLWLTIDLCAQLTSGKIIRLHSCEKRGSNSWHKTDRNPHFLHGNYIEKHRFGWSPLLFRFIFNHGMWSSSFLIKLFNS